MTSNTNCNPNHHYGVASFGGTVVARGAAFRGEAGSYRGSYSS